jgi:hypothetical protein
MAALTIIIVGWCAQERGSRRRFQRLASLTCGNARPVHRLRETWRNEWICAITLAILCACRARSADAPVNFKSRI